MFPRPTLWGVVTAKKSQVDNSKFLFSDKDVVQLVTENLIDRTKTSRMVKRKLVELGLIEGAVRITLVSLLESESWFEIVIQLAETEKRLPSFVQPMVSTGLIFGVMIAIHWETEQIYFQRHQDRLNDANFFHRCSHL